MDKTVKTMNVKSVFGIRMNYFIVLDPCWNWNRGDWCLWVKENRVWIKSTSHTHWIIYHAHLHSREAWGKFSTRRAGVGMWVSLVVQLNMSGLNEQLCLSLKGFFLFFRRRRQSGLQNRFIDLFYATPCLLWAKLLKFGSWNTFHQRQSLDSDRVF